MTGTPCQWRLLVFSSLPQGTTKRLFTSQLVRRYRCYITIVFRTSRRAFHDRFMFKRIYGSNSTNYRHRSCQQQQQRRIMILAPDIREHRRNSYPALEKRINICVTAKALLIFYSETYCTVASIGKGRQPVHRRLERTLQCTNGYYVLQLETFREDKEIYQYMTKCKLFF